MNHTHSLPPLSISVTVWHQLLELHLALFSPVTQSVSLQSCISSFLSGVELRVETLPEADECCCTNQCLLPDLVHKDKRILSPLCYCISFSLSTLQLKSTHLSLRSWFDSLQSEGFSPAPMEATDPDFKDPVPQING